MSCQLLRPTMLNEQMDGGLGSGVAHCLEPLAAPGPPPTLCLQAGSTVPRVSAVAGSWVPRALRLLTAAGPPCHVPAHSPRPRLLSLRCASRGCPPSPEPRLPRLPQRGSSPAPTRLLFSPWPGSPCPVAGLSVHSLLCLSDQAPVPSLPGELVIILQNPLHFISSHGAVSDSGTSTSSSQGTHTAPRRSVLSWGSA